MNKEAAQALVQAAKRRSQTMLDLRQSGYAQLLISEGKAEGKAEGRAEAILAILEARRVPLTEATRMKIQACQDLDLLKQWLMMAVGGHDVELRQQVEALKSK